MKRIFIISLLLQAFAYQTFAISFSEIKEGQSVRLTNDVQYVYYGSIGITPVRHEINFKKGEIFIVKEKTISGNYSDGFHYPTARKYSVALTQLNNHDLEIEKIRPSFVDPEFTSFELLDDVENN